MADAKIPTMVPDVQFKSGSHYSYTNVPPEAHKAFMDADSKGGYFSKNFTDRYKHTKVA